MAGGIHFIIEIWSSATYCERNSKVTQRERFAIQATSPLSLSQKVTPHRDCYACSFNVITYTPQQDLIQLSWTLLPKAPQFYYRRSSTLDTEARQSHDLYKLRTHEWRQHVQGSFKSSHKSSSTASERLAIPAAIRYIRNSFCRFHGLYVAISRGHPKPSMVSTCETLLHLLSRRFEKRRTSLLSANTGWGCDQLRATATSPEINELTNLQPPCTMLAHWSNFLLQDLTHFLGARLRCKNTSI